MHFKVAPLLVPLATHTQRLGGTQKRFLENPPSPLKGCQPLISRKAAKMEQNMTPMLPCTGCLALSDLPWQGCNVTLTLWSPQLAQILPTEENFLLCFRQHVGSSTEFMEVRPRRCRLSCTLGPAFHIQRQAHPMPGNGLWKTPNPFWVAQLLKVWSVDQGHQCRHDLGAC